MNHVFATLIRFCVRVPVLSAKEGKVRVRIKIRVSIKIRVKTRLMVRIRIKIRVKTRIKIIRIRREINKILYRKGKI